MRGKRSRVGGVLRTVLVGIALIAASCNSSERRAESTQSATTTPMAQVTNPCAATAAPAQPGTTTPMAKVANPCAAQAANPCNPCAAKTANPCNPCAATAANPCNPCAAKNPCAAESPIDPQLVTRPAGTELFEGSRAELVQLGKQLWQDRSLGTSGLACQTCHLNHAGFQPTFAQPYPHQVAMPLQRAGLSQVDLDEMVQVCMVIPMAAEPLPWDSKELAALTAYAHEVQQDFIKAAAANPCMLKPNTANPCNPCATKAPQNPCNPCAATNPCTPGGANMPQNPCNPCAATNPCAGNK